MLSRRWLAVTVLAVLVVGPVKAGKLYKWVDDQGNVHYSDTVPPDEAKKRRKREVKSDTGQTVETIEPPPTREELQARERARKKAEEERRRQEAVRARQQERDQALLMTYQSVADMERARDDRLAAMESQITLIQSRIDKLETQLAKQRKQAARMERSGRGDPGPVYAQIRQLRGNIEDNRRFIEEKRQAQQRLREEFDQDIKRFRELEEQEKASK
ncbi:MAG: DUF4124 domain-containing protein [Ectothiorhodospiraceae bacterium]|jgi:hypothetical protein